MYIELCTVDVPCIVASLDFTVCVRQRQPICLHVSLSSVHGSLSEATAVNLAASMFTPYASTPGPTSIAM